MEDLNKKQLAIYQLKWAAIYMAVPVVIMLFLPCLEFKIKYAQGLKRY